MATRRLSNAVDCDIVTPMKRLVAVSFMAIVAAACASADQTIAPVLDDSGASDGSAQRDGSPGDASIASDASDAGGCGEFTGNARFACSKDGNSRGKCIAQAPQIEACSRGCLRSQAPADDVCMGTTTSWSCNGLYGTTKASDGDYYLTAFGCWVDANATTHVDPTDNCIPACFGKAQSSGLCQKTDTGPQCEEKVNWYVADSGRFGCLARLRVENPKNNKKVIVVVLDAGPGCSVESKVQKAILDASGRVDEYLFGAQLGYSDKGLVHVVEVDPSTPLGPI